MAGDATTRLEGFCLHGLICDVLVNSAGWPEGGDGALLMVNSASSISTYIPYRLTSIFCREWWRADRRVINLVHVGSFRPYMLATSPAKVRARLLELHQELRRTGVTVTCVAPGPVSTEFLQRSGAYRAVLSTPFPGWIRRT